MSPGGRFGRAVLAVLLANGAAFLWPGTARSAPPAPATDALEEIRVVATGLFPGIGVDAVLVPTHVQHVDASSIARQHEHDIGEVLNSSATSISVNDTEGNPFQRDVSFRGLTASPVLGTPIGMSVFVDGVRVNEAFGDTVNWDLISSQTISQLDVVPGSDPVYGLNTLAGAIAIQTKRGRTNPGTTVECTGGSFGRLACGLETGDVRGIYDYYAAVDGYHDRGWGQANPSSLQHYFGRVGLHSNGVDVSLSASLADDQLYGNQTIPLAFLSNPTQAYTYPDQNNNRLLFLNLLARAPVGGQWLVAGSVHYRRLHSYVYNSNVNGDYDPQLGLQPGNTPTGNAINNIDQYRPGASMQANGESTLFGRANSLTIGGEWERGATDFLQSNQDAGYSRDTSSNAPAVLQTSIHALNEIGGLYVNDNWRATERIALTAAARYTRAHTRLYDNLGTANDGNETFSRLLQSAGATYQRSRAMRFYTSFSEGMRVPSPVELTCANPNAPCQLPNAFSSDPPLRAVVAHTFELGIDGKLGDSWSWNADIYRTTLLGDIQFISAGAGSPNSGYFQNVGPTRRQGFETSLTGRVERLTIALHYGYTLAQFRSTLVLYSPDNTAPGGCAVPAGCTSIAVHPGDRIPGVPLHNGRLRAEYAVSERTSIAVESIVQSDQYARGDENNQDARGPVPGFVVLNLDAHYTASERLSLFARIANVLNREYSTFGELGTNYFTGAGETYVNPVSTAGGTVGPTSGTLSSSVAATQFRSVGPPRGAWVGVTYGFGRT